MLRQAALFRVASSRRFQQPIPRANRANATAAQPKLKSNYKNNISFFVNGKKFDLKEQDIRPEMTLLDFLRSPTVGLTGSKLGCAEGGCGACTVMVSRFDSSKDKVEHFSVNGCLAPVCSVDGMAVTTIEGLGTVKDGLDPVQTRMAAGHGSQCGFCTPGIAMAAYAYLRANPTATAHEIEHELDGNLCRCTGYRPLLDALRVFGKDLCATTDPQVRSQAAELEKAKGAASSSSSSSSAACPSSGKPCDCGKVKLSGAVHSRADLLPSLQFPAELKQKKTDAPLKIKGASGVEWWRPNSLADLLELKNAYPHAKLVGGNSEVGIEAKFKHAKYPVLISPAAVPELNQIRVDSAGVTVGSAVPFTKVIEQFERIVKSKGAQSTYALKACLDQLEWFAGNQIRNVACFGGNIATASPISDLNPVLVASNATLTIAKLDKTGNRAVERKVRLGEEEFFIGYRKIAMDPDEVIVSVQVPFTRPMEFVRAFKQSRRRDDDIAIVNACFRVLLEQDSSRGSHALKVREFSVAYGGVGPNTIRPERTEADLRGKSWNRAESLDLLYRAVQRDVTLTADAPGGMVRYRRSLCTSFAEKFFSWVEHERASGAKLADSSALKVDKDLVRDYARPQSKGTQFFEKVDESAAPVHQPMAHVAALKQVSGEAIYTDDIPPHVNELQAAFILATRAHAKIKSINTSKAEKMPGVHGILLAKDIPGNNKGLSFRNDEEVFVSEVIPSMGQPIGLVVADTQQQAADAARVVVVEMEELPAIVTIDDAIKANSFMDIVHTLEKGNASEAIAKSEVVIEGEVRVGGQEHFYLEPNISLAIPSEDNEMVIWSSTQNPSHTQEAVANVLGIPQNRIVLKVKRMGGGFGGKETRSIFISAAAAVAAQKFGRPVRLLLDRDVDMAITGGRHPFLGKYKVGASRDGKINGLSLELFSNAGCSYDLSLPVMDRALFHSDNVYRIDNVALVGKLCKTNLPSNTAFRGFGGPQAMLIAEAWVDHLARELNLPPNEIRQRNFYRRDGDETHFHQPLLDCQIRNVWEQLLKQANYQERVSEVEQFNKTHKYIKRGIAMVPTKFGLSFTAKFMNQAGALVNIYNDGTVLVSHGGTEMGQGLHTKVIQIAARALGVSAAKVHIAETATDKVPNTAPTAASVQSDLNGMAVLNACEKLSERLAPLRKKYPNKSFAEIIHA